MRPMTTERSRTVDSAAVPEDDRICGHPMQVQSNMRETKVLAIIDNFGGSGGVIDFLTDLADRGGRLKVGILNVQPQPNKWQTRSLSRDAERDRLINNFGKPALASARRGLEQAGIETTERVELGGAVEIIIRQAAQEDFDILVLPAEPLSVARRWLVNVAHLSIGSIPAEVVQLATVPVVVVTRNSKPSPTAR